MSKEKMPRLCGEVLQQLALKENIVLEHKRSEEQPAQPIITRIYSAKDLEGLSGCLDAALEDEPIRRKLGSRHKNPVKSIVTPYIQRVTCAYKQKKLSRENLAGEMRNNILCMQRDVAHYRINQLPGGHRNDNAAGVHVMNSLLLLSEDPRLSFTEQATQKLLHQLKICRDEMVSQVDCVRAYASAKWQRHGLPVEVLQESSSGPWPVGWWQQSPTF